MRERKIYISLARVICAFAVVMIHTNVCFNEFNTASCWTLANIIDCGLGFAVPVFIMISGATLIDYKERYTTKEFFLKRIQKTVIPFLIWSLIGVVLDVNTFFVYYFFIHLFGVYMCIPLFANIQEEYKEKVIIYGIPVSLLLNIANGFLAYALIGYWVSKKELKPQIRGVLYLLSLIGFILHIGGTYICSMEAGSIDNTFRGYTNIPCILSSIGVFVFIKQIGQNIQNEKLIKGIEWLSGYTFPVYLIHYYVIKLMMEPVFGEIVHSVWYKLFAPITTIVLSVVIAWLIRKIPLIRKILP